MAEAVVPCGTCVLCCHGRIFLFPQEETTLPTVWDTRADGRRLRRLIAKPDGECSHLIDGACSVYDQRPRICRQFSCMEHFHLPSAERRRREALLVSARDKAIIARGRELAEEAMRREVQK